MDKLLQRARQALDSGSAHLALSELQQATELAPKQAQLWKLLGAACHQEQLEVEAVAALTRALVLNSGDASTAMMLAQSRFLAGYPAYDDFARAAQLAPGDLNATRGCALALGAEGQREQAQQLLLNTLAQHPDWLPGHKLLASLRFTGGDHQNFAAAYASATALMPKHLPLWLEWFRALVQVRHWDQALAVLEAATKACGERPELRLARLLVAAESGQDQLAKALFIQTAESTDVTRAMALVRFSLRRGDLAQAERTARAFITPAHGRVFWPYLALIWRLTDNPLSQWLEGDSLGVFAQQIDLSEAERQALIHCLRGLHSARSPFAEQSVRGGTQTDQNLFLRHEPIIRLLKSRVQQAVVNYVRQLPAPVEGHPLLGIKRDAILEGRVHFSGSWSVRLAAQGHNVSHTHPLGWISSALYISLPEPEQMGPEPAGYIQFGSPPPELNLALQPQLRVKPEPGRLVMFPSTTWHSTVPFKDGERLVVAFDVKLPH